MVAARVYVLALLPTLFVATWANDLDRAHAALRFPRTHLRAATPEAIRAKLNQQLISSSAVKMMSYSACNDFSLEELNALLLQLNQYKHHDLASVPGREARHMNNVSLLSELKREMFDLAASPHIEEPIRHGKCHEIAMQWVHHLDSNARAKLAHLRLPLLPIKGTHEHAPELLRGGHVETLRVLAQQTSCQTGHAANAEARSKWTPSDFPAWPFEVTYEAHGYGPYPFWANNTPGSGALTGSGKLISTTYSAVLDAEKLDHMGGCSLGQMELGWSEDAPCTLLMLGNKYNYLYDDKQTSCCVASTPQGQCPLTPMKRDFFTLFKLQGNISSFATESGSYNGSAKKYSMHIDLPGPGPTGPFFFWYVTDENGVPVEQGEAGCDSCIAQSYGDSQETHCKKTATIDGKRDCSRGPKFLFHQYNRSTFKSVTLDPSVFTVPAVCRNTTYQCPVSPADQLCSTTAKHQDIVV